MIISKARRLKISSFKFSCPYFQETAASDFLIFQLDFLDSRDLTFLMIILLTLPECYIQFLMFFLPCGFQKACLLIGR